MRGPKIEKALLWLLAVSAAARADATNASETCDIIVRIGYPEGLAPYAVAAPTQWLDGMLPSDFFEVLAEVLAHDATVLGAGDD